MVAGDESQNISLTSEFFAEPVGYVCQLGRERPVLFAASVLLGMLLSVMAVRDQTHVAGVDLRLTSIPAGTDGRNEIKSLQGELQYLWATDPKNSGRLSVESLPIPGVRVQLTADETAGDSLQNLLRAMQELYTERQTTHAAELKSSIRSFFELVGQIQSECGVTIADVNMQADIVHDVQPGAFPVMDSSLFTDPLYSVYRTACSAMRTDILRTPPSDSDTRQRKLKLIADFTIAYQHYRNRLLQNKWDAYAEPLAEPISVERVTMLEQFRLPAMQGAFWGTLAGLSLAFVLRLLRKN